ncbi:MAG: DUF917 domain-containing protein [Microbacteriaceae bacterium]|jgi:DUF917 family protein|nr:DUF917 domain-containing protein [Microbacteriaceae bacterium]
MTVAIQSVSAITAAELPALAAGSQLLGCGGGGYTAQELWALQRRGEDLRATIAPLDSSFGTCALVGYVGSTLVLAEELPSGQELSTAVFALERWTGRKVTSVLPAEIGGVIALASVDLSAQAHLPVVDADGIGRSTPRLDQLAPLHGSSQPVSGAVVTPTGLVSVVDTRGPDALETALRDIAAHNGGWGGFAIGPFDEATVRERAVPGTISRAVALGSDLLQVRSQASSIPLSAAPLGWVPIRGRVLDVQHETSAVSFVRGSAAIQDLTTGQVARIEMGSEYLYLAVDGEPAASAPDCICVLGMRDLTPINTDDIRSGMYVEVLVLETPRPLGGLSLPVPAEYGLPFEPVRFDARRIPEQEHPATSVHLSAGGHNATR